MGGIPAWCFNSQSLVCTTIFQTKTQNLGEDDLQYLRRVNRSRGTLPSDVPIPAWNEHLALWSSMSGPLSSLIDSQNFRVDATDTVTVDL